MSAEITKAIVDRFWDEVWNKKNLAIADELLPDNVILHNFLRFWKLEERGV